MSRTVEELRKVTQSPRLSIQERIRLRHSRLQKGQWRSPGEIAILVTDDKNKEVKLKPDLDGKSYSFTSELMTVPGNLLIMGNPSGLQFGGYPTTQLNDSGLFPSTILTPNPVLQPSNPTGDLDKMLQALLSIQES